MDTIIKAGGGVAKLARELRLHHTTVMGWKSVPPHHAREVSRLTGKSLHELRPDLWDERESDDAKTIDENAERQSVGRDAAA